MHFNNKSKEGAVYCNDAIHWIRNQSKGMSLPHFSVSDESDDDREEFRRPESDVLHYFDIGEESLRLAAATPPVPLFVKNIQLDEDGYPIRFRF
ncbi:hypothetical protein M0R45_018244 [Rubus argutus]|uniref:Uncharacterized protein n=1 Tax=Rubus argutus TaxID=59490 RepID=A0AAW1X4H8_RUBAR